MFFLHILYIVYAFVPPFMAIAAVTFDLDPIFFLLDKDFHQKPLLLITVYFIRITVTFVAIFELFRIFPLLITIMMTYTQMIFNCLTYLRKLSFSFHGLLNFETTHREYIKMVLLFRVCLSLQSQITVLYLAVGMSFVIGLSFGSVKLYDLAPLPLYLIFPIILCSVIVLISHAVPRMTHVYEHSKTLIEDWKRLSPYCPYNRRIIVRLIKSTCPIVACLAMPGGSMVPMNRGVKVSYYKKTVEYTVSALLAFPKSSLATV
jgi:hypothetical protein